MGKCYRANSYPDPARPERLNVAGNKKPQTFRDCACCGVRFGPVPNLKVRFCSKACAYRSATGRPNPGSSLKKKGRPNLARRRRVLVKCWVCGKTFECHAYRADAPRHFCSRECFGKSAGFRSCAVCGASFQAGPTSTQSFCSRKCSSFFHSGPNHPGWKGGSGQDDRNRPEVRLWRKAVFERDGHRCRDCGSAEDLHAHHIKPWVTFPDLRLVLSNGRTLCSRCHSRVHGRDLTKWTRKFQTAQRIPPPQV